MSDAPPRWFHVFDTALGPCALVWSDVGVVGFRFPDVNAKVTERHLAAAFPGATPALLRPPWIDDAIARIALHLAGDLQDLRQIPLDLSGVTPFRARVYEALRKVPPGSRTTYGALAAAAGSPSGAARAVGAAMAHNPVGLLIPCHRVVSSTGKLTGFSAPGGVGTKARLLEIESPAGDAQMPLFVSHGDAELGSHAEDTSFDPMRLAAAAEETSFDPMRLAAAAEDTSFDPMRLAAAAEDTSFDPAKLAGSDEDTSFDPAAFGAAPPDPPPAELPSAVVAEGREADPKPLGIKQKSTARSPRAPRRRPRTATPDG